MFKKLLRFFTGPTPGEAYQNGRNCADETLRAAFPEDRAHEAGRLFDRASGGFNETDAHHAFDRGVTDRLIELGYPPRGPVQSIARARMCDCNQGREPCRCKSTPVAHHPDTGADA